ncbi:dUTP diphosphatase [Patescibacteria group bacterium]|nr:dUTP diphosphatase [Patescibacteria group bacterium]
MLVNLKIKKLHPDAILPQYSLPGDAGLDLSSIANITIPAKRRKSIRTGLAIVFPKGYCGLIWDRSGLAHKEGITTMGGVFEHTYRGEYIIALYNTGTKPYRIKKGQRIAQLLIQPIATGKIIQVKKLSTTTRGSKAFGSTGK